MPSASKLEFFSPEGPEKLPCCEKQNVPERPTMAPSLHSSWTSRLRRLLMLPMQTWTGAMPRPRISVEPPRGRWAATVLFFTLDQEQKDCIYTPLAIHSKQTSSIFMLLAQHLQMLQIIFFTVELLVWKPLTCLIVEHFYIYRPAILCFKNPVYPSSDISHTGRPWLLCTPFLLAQTDWRSQYCTHAVV